MAKKQIDSPGLARMRKRLGKAGTETLRRAVLKDQRTAKKKVRRKNPARLFAAADTITVMVPDAPKVGDSARRFSLLCSGMTVADFVAAGGRRRDVRRGT